MVMDFAYTYTHAKTDQTALLTTRSSLIPKHAASAWVNYKFDGQFDGLLLDQGFVILVKLLMKSIIQMKVYLVIPYGMQWLNISLINHGQYKLMQLT